MQRYTVVTLCGSTRFKRELECVNALLTMQGCIVLSVGVFKDYFGRPLIEEAFAAEYETGRAFGTPKGRIGEGMGE